MVVIFSHIIFNNKIRNKYQNSVMQKFENFEEFYNNIMSLVENKPSQWRKGQAVFNYIEEYYGVSRQVQFIDGCDCFYDDTQIDDFIKCSFNRLKDGKQEN